MADRFAPGDRVRTRTVDPPGHTRLPRYARGKRGVVDRFHGADTLPDASAHGRGPSPEPQAVYHVRFAAADLFGDGDHTVTVELWQDYLTPIEEAP